MGGGGALTSDIKYPTKFQHWPLPAGIKQTLVNITIQVAHIMSLDIGW